LPKKEAMAAPAAPHRLRITPRAAALTIGADRTLERLFRISSHGARPRVREHDGETEVDYTLGGRLRALSSRIGSLTVALNPTAVWAIELRGGVSGLRADLRDLTVSGVAITGSAHDIAVDLGRLAPEVVVQITGSVSEAIVRRPPGVPAALEINGGATGVRLDGEDLGPSAGALRRQSGGEASGDGEIAVRIHGAASGVTIEAASG
jgi:hypothetical protein